WIGKWSSHRREIAQKGQPGRLALLRVELSGVNIVAPDAGREFPAITTTPVRHRRVRGRHVIGVHEIEMRARFKPPRERAFPALVGPDHLVPPHVWDFELPLVGQPAEIKSPDLTGDDAQPAV